MNLPDLDGPRLLLAEERQASDELSRLCFGRSFVGEGEPWEQPGETHVIACQGKPVSQISLFHTLLLVQGSAVQVGSIGGVCTHPDYRGHGLASLLMGHCADRLLAGGARLMLISGERGLYTRLGCARVGRYASFTLRPGQLGPAPARVRLRPAQAADALACSRLYQAEAVHFSRPLERFTRRLAHPEYTAAENWLVELDGRPAAYLLLRLPWEYLHNPQAGVRSLEEYAGERLAIAAALAQMSLAELRLAIPWQDFELIDWLSQRGARPTWAPLPEHTLRILDFPGLMADLRPYRLARLDAADLQELRVAQRGPLLKERRADRAEISLGAERLELDGAALASLVMGSPGEPAALRKLRPGRLRAALSALFPLPSFLPGLDYQ